MASFSWSDTARAVFGSCLTCLPSAERHRLADDDDGHRRRGHGSLRRDELESLLQGAEHGDDAEMDVDALSLHSRLGQQDGQRTSSSSRRKKRTRNDNNNNRGRITLFGFDLFGRPLRSPAASSGGEEEEQDNVVDDGEDEPSRRISRLSSSTLDSDAAPLAEEAIAALSAQTQAQREAARRKKKGAAAARKRMRRDGLVESRGDAQPGEGFEGFPGGEIGPDDYDDFGTFQEAQQTPRLLPHDGGPPPPPSDDDVDGDDARADFDFDAGSYVRGAAGPRSDSGSGTTRTRSRSASASNTSSSDPAARVHGIHTLPRYSGPVSPAVPSSSKLKPKRVKRSGKRSTTTGTGTTVSSSVSQPRSPTDDAHVPRIDVASSPTFEGFPEDDDETFEGGPHEGGDVASRALKLKLVTGESAVVRGGLEGDAGGAGGFPSPGLMPGSRFPSAGLGRSSGFPSLGLGEGKRPPSMRSHQGAFLARTGDDT